MAQFLCVFVILFSVLVNVSSFAGNTARRLTAIAHSSTAPRSASLALYMAKKKTKRKAPTTPEFSRVLNAEQVPPNRPVLCRLVAKEVERAGLAERFDLPNITYFAANVTASRPDSGSVLIEGSLEAHIKVAELSRLDRITSTFDTMLLDSWYVGPLPPHLPTFTD
jgi:hypothetical protein